MSLYPFVRNFNYTDAPPHTQELIKTCLLDIIGVAAGASDNHTTTLLKTFATHHHPAASLASRLWFDGRPVHPLGAAWAGGFSVDSLDGHEGHFTSKGHAGATVVPGVIALVDAWRQQGRSLSGVELLSVLCIGYETALRAGRALMATAPEYHASGAFSGVGLVCAGARLLGMDQTRLRHAMGIAEYFGPRCPMMRLIDHPSMLRDAHGAGAHAGINALLMAQVGVTGAPALSVEADAVAIHWSGLGERWEIDEQYFKPWPVCRWAQPALTALAALMAAQPDIQGASIESVQIETFHESVRLQGHEPADADEAQYALAFPVAAMIARGRVGAQEVTGDAVRAADILEVSRKVRIVEAVDLSQRFPDEILSRVTVSLKDGRSFASPTTAAKGDPGNPMSPAEFRGKFLELANRTLGHARSEAIVEAVAHMQDSSDCSTLLDLILRPR